MCRATPSPPSAPSSTGLGPSCRFDRRHQLVDHLVLWSPSRIYRRDSDRVAESRMASRSSHRCRRDRRGVGESHGNGRPRPALSPTPSRTCRRSALGTDRRRFDGPASLLRSSRLTTADVVELGRVLDRHGRILSRLHFDTRHRDPSRARASMRLTLQGTPAGGLDRSLTRFHRRAPGSAGSSPRHTRGADFRAAACRAPDHADRATALGPRTRRYASCLGASVTPASRHHCFSRASPPCGGAPRAAAADGARAARTVVARSGARAARQRSAPRQPPTPSARLQTRSSLRPPLHRRRLFVPRGAVSNPWHEQSAATIRPHRPRFGHRRRFPAAAARSIEAQPSPASPPTRSWAVRMDDARHLGARRRRDVAVVGAQELQRQAMDLALLVGEQHAIGVEAQPLALPALDQGRMHRPAERRCVCAVALEEVDVLVRQHREHASVRAAIGGGDGLQTRFSDRHRTVRRPRPGRPIQGRGDVAAVLGNSQARRLPSTSPRSKLSWRCRACRLVLVP